MRFRLLVPFVALLALPAPAHADPVATAQARVDALQGLARRTTAQLTEGTKRWEADQDRLRALRLDLGNTTRHVAQAQGQLEAQQSQVDAIAHDLYTQPVPRQFQALITRGPDQVIDALRSQLALDVVSGGQARIIARTATARSRLKTQERDASLVVAEAARLTAASAKRLAALKDLAASTSRQLSTAQDALAKALSDRAAAAAAAASAKARAARARAAAVIYVGGGGAACTGRSTSGQANGNLDPGSLCPLWMAPGERLRADAAAAFNKLSQYHAGTVGSPLCVTDSYRSYSEQVAVYQEKPGLAAVPGSSNHGWGQAVDFCGGIQDSGSAAYQWMKANAGRFGWVHPSWAEPGGNRPEPWHWEFGTGG